MGNIQFDLLAFVKNLQFMGLGMVGVFIIVGIIILATHFTSFTIKKVEEQKAAKKDKE